MSLLSVSDELLVSARSREQAARLRDVLPEARAVPDDRHDRGPIEGFARGFEAARGDIVLVAPCDAPLLGPALYRLLLEVLESHEAAVPRLGAIDPLRAVYRTGAARRGMAERAPRCPASLVDALRPILVEADELREADPSLVVVPRRESRGGPPPGGSGVRRVGGQGVRTGGQNPYGGLPYILSQRSPIDPSSGWGFRGATE